MPHFGWTWKETDSIFFRGPMSLAEHERAVQERIPLRCRVSVRRPGVSSLEGETIDISVSGALVNLPESPELGSELSLAFELPDAEEPLEIEAIPVRAERSSHAELPHRIGFRFAESSEAVAPRIRRLVCG